MEPLCRFRCPFFGSFQSALLYPPNWLYLILPIDRAVNADIVLHVLLTGLVPVRVDVVSRLESAGQPGVRRAADVRRAVLLSSLSGTSVAAGGHGLGAAAVAGLRRTAGEAFAGLVLWWALAAVSMQILAGYPQMFFYTLIAVGLYCLLTLPGVEHRVQALAAGSRRDVPVRRGPAPACN